MADERPNSLKVPNSVMVYVGLDRLGDGLLKLPFVRALRAAFPAARLTWVAGKEGSTFAGPWAPVVKGLLDEVIEWADLGVHPRELLRWRPRGPLAGRAFDLVIDTQRILWVSLCVRRVRHRAFVSPAAGFRLSDAKPPKGHRRPRALQDELLDLLAVVTGTPAAPVARIDLPVDDTLRAAAARLLPAGPAYVGIAPGSGAELKCWPLERFVALAEVEHAKGRTPVFFLGPREAAWHADLRARFPEARFPLQEAATGTGADRPAYSPLLTVALAGRLQAAVSNDSGAAHLLAAGGAPLVALYGPTAPGKYRPPTGRLTVVQAADFGGREMAAIPLGPALAALEAALAQSPAGAAAATGTGGG